jgi:hypothetical protein
LNWDPAGEELLVGVQAISAFSAPARTPTLLIQRVTRQDLGSAGVSGAVSWGFARAWRLRLSTVRDWRRQSHH